MAKIKLTFPDGKVNEFEKGITSKEIVEGIGPGLAQAALAAEVNGRAIDLSAKVTEDGDFRILTWKDEAGKEVFRHSSAHLLAQAITRLYPKAKLTIGPVVDEGFYYDIDCEPFTPEDIKKIEQEMYNIMKERVSIHREEVSKKDALKEFKGNEFKEEMINELDDNEISLYRQGDFVDLCRGPHLLTTGAIKAFKITKIAGAYWRADAKNKQLQRIYGISFPDKKELKQYLTIMEEAEKRDHRKIGQKMELFSIHDEGPGFPFFHPKGMVLKNELMDFWRKEHTKAGYVEVQTPIILSKELWEKSGHWDHYRENMYFTEIDGAEYAIKPMNCPGGMIFYNSKKHSYKEFPLRVGEFGLVHRHEMSGVLAGLFRVRCFTQDDAHIFMTPDQIKDEIKRVILLTDKFYKETFGFEYDVELSTLPEKSMVDDKTRDLSEKALKDALEELKIPYKINPGDGAFYGPKIDFHIKDCIGRTWQCGTIQLDYSMPEKFDLTYMGEDGTENHRPTVIHRVIYGSMERFIGILIEHYAGKFPLWLSPVQVRVLTIVNKLDKYAKEVEEKLSSAGIRVETDFRPETLNKKVREAQLDNVNYILVIGEKEAEKGTVNIRTRDNKVHGEKKVDEFLKELLSEIGAHK